ncbi:unnamed protein product [Cylindrotheca closterium]|uniref:Uncharacterized protein n=1 Tax=Cylindrotheca closterium TaxID=2856 RepID=A0AAD2CPJ3_9STRA|nr:unnamed protein product [Cylindrotheca closterium]
MKIVSSLIPLLCVGNAAAFHVQQQRTSGTALPASSSYLGGLGSSAAGGDTAFAAGARTAGMAPPVPEGAGLASPPPPQSPPVKFVELQGESLKTWSFPSKRTERVRINLKTDERPLQSEIEIWQGPDNTPNKIRCYVEDGKRRDFSVVVETPFGGNTLCVKNIAHMEFPMYAAVEPLGPASRPEFADGVSRTIQGGALRTYAFEGEVVTVQVMLTTDGRPLNARIELLQGPNNIKQVMEVYTEDGLDRPFFSLIDTPGVGNVVRVVNTASMEFPLTAMVEPFEIDPDMA